MARARKTIKVADVVVEVNRMLDESTCESSIRLGMISVLEMVLHRTNNYRGFSYLSLHHPGLDQPGHDDSRRRYR